MPANLLGQAKPKPETQVEPLGVGFFSGRSWLANQVRGPLRCPASGGRSAVRIETDAQTFFHQVTTKEAPLWNIEGKRTSNPTGALPETFLATPDIAESPSTDAQASGCPEVKDSTTLRHVSFELASSMSTWPSRQELVKLWWKPGQMRGHVWIDKKVPQGEEASILNVRDSQK